MNFGYTSEFWPKSAFFLYIGHEDSEMNAADNPDESAGAQGGAPGSGRFKKVTAEELDDIASNTHAQTTKQQTKWSVKLFKGTMHTLK